MALRFLIFLLCFCGHAAVAQRLPALIPYTDGGKWGYADTNGRVVIAPQWSGVHFFIGDRARVLLSRPSHGLVHSITDRAGRYIIPPWVGWTGNGGNWAGGLNAMDSTGRWGLVDTTTGEMIIPHRWDAPGHERLAGAMRDSFMVVASNGLAGLINRRGAFVVPLVWGNITALPGIPQDSLLQVQDPDNLQGANSKGVISITGHRVLPARYHDIRLVNIPGSGAAFQLTTASLSAGMHSSAGIRVKWIDISSGKEVPRPATVAESGAPPEQQEPGGYISFGNWGYPRGLMDSSRNVIIPCCSVMKVTADTIFLRGERQAGEDSVVYTSSHLDTRTRKPLGATQTMVMHREKPVSRDYYHHSSPYELSLHEPVQIEIPGYGNVRKFYKDSMLYSVTGYATAGARKLYLVAGNVVGAGPGSVRNYYAVVDSNLKYVAGPLLNISLLGYNPEQDLLIGYGVRGGKTGTTLLSRDGQALMRPPDEELIDGFRWRGGVYAYTVVRRETDGLIETFQYRRETPVGEVHLIDSSGKRVPQLVRHRIATWFSGSPPGSFSGRVPVAVLDTAGRVSYVWPDGTAAWPKLSFRYKFLNRVTEDWFLADLPTLSRTAKGGNTIRHLVDRNNRRVAGGFQVHRIDAAFLPSNLHYQSNGQKSAIPRLYFATGLEEKTGKDTSFFIDDRGRVYHAASAQ